MSAVIAINYVGRAAEFKATEDITSAFYIAHDWDLTKAQMIVDKYNHHITRAHELEDEAYRLNTVRNFEASQAKTRGANGHRRRANKVYGKHFI